MSGVLIEGHKSIVDGKEIYDFSYINIFWIGAALLSVFFAFIGVECEIKGLTELSVS